MRASGGCSGMLSLRFHHPASFHCTCKYAEVKAAPLIVMCFLCPGYWLVSSLSWLRGNSRENSRKINSLSSFSHHAYYREDHSDFIFRGFPITPIRNNRKPLINRGVTTSILNRKPIKMLII